MPKINVLIAGSTGYIGIQLIKLLVKHKNVKIKYLCGNSSVGKNVSYFDNIEEACNKVDLVIIHTEWEEFKVLDFNKLAKRKKFKIYDMRNLYSPNLMRKKGFSYYSIGR